MICEGCGNPVVDSTCACPSIVPDLKAQNVKLLEENLALKTRLDQEWGDHIVCNYLHQPGCICGRTIAEQKKKLDAWARYHRLLSEEIDSAVGMAWVHGWRSTPERIEQGIKLRAELGLPAKG